MNLKFLKKLSAVILCFILIFSITACNKAKETNTEPDVTPTTTEEPTQEPTQAPTQEPTQAPTQAPEPIETAEAAPTGRDIVFLMDPEYVPVGWTAQVDSGWVLGDSSKNATIGYTAENNYYNITHDAGWVDKVYVGFGEDLSLSDVSAITVYLKGTPDNICIKAANMSFTGTDYEWLTHENESGDHFAVTGVASTAYPEYKAYTIDVSAYTSEKIGGLLIGDFNLEGTEIDVALAVTLTYGSTFTMDPEYVPVGWTAQVDSGWVLGDSSKSATISHTAENNFYNITHDAGWVDKVYIGFGEDLDLTNVSAVTIYLKGTPDNICIKAANMSFTGTDYEWLTHENESGDHFAVTGVTSTAYPEYKAYTIDVSTYASEKIGGFLIGDFTLEGTEIDVALTATLTYGSSFTMDPEYIPVGWKAQVDSGWVLGDSSKNATIGYTAENNFYSITQESGFVDKVYVGFGEDLDLAGVSAITVYLKGTPDALCIKAANQSFTGTEYEWLTHDLEGNKTHFAVKGITSTAYPEYKAYTIDVSNYASEKIGGLLIGDFELEGNEINVALTVTCNKSK
jgi:hypothetical protein